MILSAVHDKLRRYFVDQGFPCPFDKTVVKIEGFPGVLDIEIRDWKSSGNLVIETFVYREDVWPKLESCFTESPAGLTRMPDPVSRKKQKNRGVGFRFDMGIPSGRVTEDQDKLISLYLAYRNALMAAIQEDQSVSDLFHIWLFGRGMIEGVDLQLLDEFLETPFFKAGGEPGACLASAYDVASAERTGKIAVGKALPPAYQKVGCDYIALFNKFCEEVVCGLKPLTAREAEDGMQRMQAYSATARIVRMLRHTERKNYENYVVTGVWHRLVADERMRRENLFVRFETQKSVKVILDGVEHDVYVDMYFPSVNIAVECDEVFHKKQTISDRKRQAAIVNKLHMRAEDFFRVDASLSFSEMDRKIAEIVNRVSEKALVEQTAVRDDWRRTNPAYIIAKAKCISESDDYAFATEGDALCALRAPRGRRQSGRGRIHSMVKNGRIYQVVFVDLPEAATADLRLNDPELGKQLEGISSYSPICLFARAMRSEIRAGYRFRGIYGFDKQKKTYVKMSTRLPL